MCWFLYDDKTELKLVETLNPEMFFSFFLTWQLPDINSALVTHEYGYTEVSNKPTALHNSILSGNAKYKLKYNADLVTVFVCLVPFSYQHT